MTFLRAIISFFLLLLISELAAQVPFVCRGEYYLTLRARRFNELFTVNIDPRTQLVTFDQVPIVDGFDLNAMGYRITDNFIYIIDQTNTGLLRIHGDGTIARLRVLEELPSYRYFAGACTPDGNYLIISGSPIDFGFGSANINLVFIDLRDPAYPTREVRLDNNRFLFFDMAFDPFTGICYGYDANNQVLCTIDITTGAMSQVGNPGQIANSMGTLFFDAFGNLYGYGRPEGGNAQNTLFNIDKLTGQVTVRTTGESADRSDGAACPFTIKLTKDAFPRETVACNEIIYTFTIANATGIVQDGIVFEDIMPDGMEIIEIVNNPFGGDRINTGRSNELVFENMVLPLGLDSLIVKVRSGADVSGLLKNQARLDNLLESLGGFTLSDDPRTLQVEDSTSVLIRPLDIDLSSQNKLICRGDSLLLSGDLPSVQYLWMDQFTGPSFAVTSEGTYWVELRSECDVSFDTIVVDYAPPITVDVGPDRSLILGDSFTITPEITGLGPFSYYWTTSDKKETLSCDDCETPTIRPFFDGVYSLVVEDGSGCEEGDELEVLVDRNIYLWIPNAFTPNDDGVNDFFYVVGQYPYMIADFSIYSRWGQKLYQNENILVNSERDGWNGYVGTQMMNPGVYVYKAIIELVDGTQQHFTGDVTLVR